jgi:hypothetical protein
MGVGVLLRSLQGIIIVLVLVREFWEGDGKYGGGKGAERRCSCIYFASEWRGVEKSRVILRLGTRLPGLFLHIVIPKESLDIQIQYLKSFMRLNNGTVTAHCLIKSTINSPRCALLKSLSTSSMPSGYSSPFHRPV